MIGDYTVKHNIEVLQSANRKVDLSIIEEAVQALIILFDCLDDEFKRMNVYKDNNSNRFSNILDYTKKISKGLESRVELLEANRFHESDPDYEISKVLNLGFNKVFKLIKSNGKVKSSYDRRLQKYNCKSIIVTKNINLKISLSWQRFSDLTEFELICKLG